MPPKYSKLGSKTTQSGSGSGSSDTSLSQQMRDNIRNMNDLVSELQENQESTGQGQPRRNANPEEQVRQLRDMNAQTQKFNKEREDILLQLQQEMCNYATIQEKFEEHERSMQMIIQELENEKQELYEALDDALADSTDNLDDLNKEVNELSKRLGNMSDENTCSICLFQWSTEGEHCLASLKCGHLFGRNCIRKCVRMHRHCPICKKYANWRDVRKIYCNGIMSSRSSAPSSSGQSTSGNSASGYTPTNTGGNAYYDSDDSY